MQNKKSKVKKVALTLALAQIMSVGAIPLNTIVGSSNANVYAATTKEIHKWKKFSVDTINIGTKKYRYIPQGGEIELVNDGSSDEEFDEGLSDYPKIEKKGAENKASYIEVGDIVSGYPYFSGSVSGIPIYTGVVTNINFGRLIINRNYTQEEIMTSKKVKGSYIEEVTSSDSNAYPKSGEKDGFWYEYSGKESIQVEDEADKFIPKTKTLNVIQGESVDLTTGLTNKPESASVEIKKPVDTKEPGQKTGIITVKFKDSSKKDVEITVNVEKKLSQADKFIPEVKKVEVRKGDPVDITKAITNLPEGATVKVKTPVDTKEPGQKTGEVTVEFKDKSTKDVKIPVTVKDWTEMGVITPVPEISKENIEREVIKVNGIVNLLDNIKGLPEDAKVEDVTAPKIDTSKAKETEGRVKVTFKDGSSRVVTIPVLIEDLEADKFVPEVKKVEVRKGDPVDITKAITNLPEGATVKVKTPVDTKEPGQKTGEVTVEFKDKSTKDVKIPVTVKDWNEMGVITPVPEISKENIEREVIKVNGIVNLLDNIKGLPEDAKVEDVTAPKIDTSKAKETEGRVKVTFKDGSSRVVTIPVLIEDLEADKFNPEIKDVTVRKGDPVDITKAITNLPEGATVKVKTPVDTKEPGQKTGEVTVEFKDKSTKDVKIPVTVKDWTEMGVITPVENIIDNIKEEVVEKGGKIDLTDNVIAKNAKSFEDVTTPEIDTNVPGQYKAKVKVTFEDGSSRIVIVPVIVLENTKDLTDKISDLEKQLKDKEKELEDAKNSCNTDKAELEKKIADKEKELENLKNATDAEKAKLQEEIDNLKKQIEDLNKKIADKDKEISELKDKIADLEKDKKALEDDKAKLQEEIDKLKKENSDLKDSDKDNADKIKELEDKITELEARDILKQDEIDRLEDEIAKLKDQLQEALYEKEQLKKENEEVKDKIKELQDLLKGVVGSNKNKDEKIKELEKEIADLKAKENSCKPQDNSKVKELEDKIKELEKELENAKKKKEESPKKPQEKEENKKEKEDPNKDLKDRLKKLINDADRELRRNRDLSREQKRDLEDAIEDANKVLKNKNSDRRDLRDAIRDLEDALDKAKNKSSKSEDINKKIEDYIRKNPGQKVGEETLSKNGQYNFLKYIFKIDSNLYYQATNKSMASYLMDTTPFIQDSRTMLPLRYVAYALGAEVRWDESTRTANFTKDGLTASIQIDGNTIKMSDGRTIIMDTNAVIKDSRTFVSLTNVYKVFEKDQNKIEWDSAKREVTINIVK